MRVETVKVYKGKDVVICNKSDVEIWNGNGYFTSSQQKKSAEDAKLKKDAEAAEKKSGVTHG